MLEEDENVYMLVGRDKYNEYIIGRFSTETDAELMINHLHYKEQGFDEFEIVAVK